jgi:hypothetical protein
MRAKGPLTAGMAAAESADVCPENVLFAARVGSEGEKRLFLFYVFPLTRSDAYSRKSQEMCAVFEIKSHAAAP